MSDKVYEVLTPSRNQVMYLDTCFCQPAVKTIYSDTDFYLDQKDITDQTMQMFSNRVTIIYPEKALDILARVSKTYKLDFSEHIAIGPKQMPKDVTGYDFWYKANIDDKKLHYLHFKYGEKKTPLFSGLTIDIDKDDPELRQFLRDQKIELLNNINDYNRSTDLITLFHLFSVDFPFVGSVDTEKVLTSYHGLRSYTFMETFDKVYALICAKELNAADPDYFRKKVPANHFKVYEHPTNKSDAISNLTYLYDANINFDTTFPISQHKLQELIKINEKML